MPRSLFKAAAVVYFVYMLVEIFIFNVFSNKKLIKEKKSKKFATKFSKKRFFSLH